MDPASSPTLSSSFLKSTEFHSVSPKHHVNILLGLFTYSSSCLDHSLLSPRSLQLIFQDSPSMSLPLVNLSWQCSCFVWPCHNTLYFPRNSTYQFRFNSLVFLNIMHSLITSNVLEGLVGVRNWCMHLTYIISYNLYNKFMIQFYPLFTDKKTGKWKLKNLTIGGILACILTWSVWFWSLCHHYIVVSCLPHGRHSTNIYWMNEFNRPNQKKRRTMRIIGNKVEKLDPDFGNSGALRSSLGWRWLEIGIHCWKHFFNKIRLATVCVTFLLCLLPQPSTWSWNI